MPKVRKSESEERKANYRARLNYLMQLNGYDNNKLSKLLGISVSGIIAKKKDFGLFRLEEIWTIEKAFHCQITEPIKLPEEKSLVG